jgi:hypothetical protein
MISYHILYKIFLNFFNNFLFQRKYKNILIMKILSTLWKIINKINI